MIRFRTATSRLGRSSGSWLTLLLLFIALVPSICLLWFVNRAAQNEQLAVRQKLIDAYRVHLVLAQERLQTHWRQLALELDLRADSTPAPELFARAIRDISADALVCFDAAGSIRYPNTLLLPLPEKPNTDWAEARNLETSEPAEAAAAYALLAEQSSDANSAARALLAQARCLVRAGDKTAALKLLTGPLEAERFRSTTDAQLRPLQPNAELLALDLAASVAPNHAQPLRERLLARALDYTDSALASPQRRFLLRELLRLSPDAPPPPATLLLAAEDLAVQWLATDATATREPLLRPSTVTGIWVFSSGSGRVVTLHRTERLLARLAAVISQSDLPTDVRVEFFAPGREIEGSLLSLPAGAAMPGWRLALSLQDQRLFDESTRARATSYLWIGGLVVVSVLILALLAWGLVRRKLALTQLRNDLVANVTHELKTPLSSMRVLVETLLNAPQLHEPTVREYLQLIATENLRLSRLIDNFLTFSRIERNKYVFAFRETSAAAIATNAAEAVRERFQLPDCRFAVAIAADLPRVRADAGALSTALINLLDNAWKYSGDTKEISLTATANAGTVVFTVRDNGIGLAPRDAKRIFQRFFQVHPHLSPTGGGCGLGLSIVQFVVSAHRGTVRVESQPGAGSTFTVTLPAVAPRSASEPTP
jgi:signal transduction histidine kinase